MPSTQHAAHILAALSEFRAALQEAHFAARRLDELMASPSDSRCSDRIHALRLEAEQVAACVGEALKEAA